MKTALILMAFLIGSACRQVRAPKPWNEKSLDTELTKEKRVKPRAPFDNRQQTEYFNSIQHR
jgi:hypothetical protein